MASVRRSPRRTANGGSGAAAAAVLSATGEVHVELRRYFVHLVTVASCPFDPLCNDVEGERGTT